MLPPEELRYAVEALLFTSEKPLTLSQIQEAFSRPVSSTRPASPELHRGEQTGRQMGAEGKEAAGESALRRVLDELRAEYLSGRRGFQLIDVAGGFQLVTDPRFAEVLKQFYQSRETRRLSQASLETLSVIAYKQPVTRADIEFIRGVNVDAALATLLEKGLVRIIGRKEVPGRPMLYGTTKEFLERFGLDNLGELPKLSQFTPADIEQGWMPPDGGSS